MSLLLLINLLFCSSDHVSCPSLYQNLVYIYIMCLSLAPLSCFLYVLIMSLVVALSLLFLFPYLVHVSYLSFSLFSCSLNHVSVTLSLLNTSLLSDPMCIHFLPLSEAKE